MKSLRKVGIGLTRISHHHDQYEIHTKGGYWIEIHTKGGYWID